MGGLTPVGLLSFVSGPSTEKDRRNSTKSTVSRIDFANQFVEGKNWYQKSTTPRSWIGRKPMWETLNKDRTHTKSFKNCQGKKRIQINIETLHSPFGWGFQILFEIIRNFLEFFFFFFVLQQFYFRYPKARFPLFYRNCIVCLSRERSKTAEKHQWRLVKHRLDWHDSMARPVWDQIVPFALCENLSGEAETESLSPTGHRSRWTIFRHAFMKIQPELRGLALEAVGNGFKFSSVLGQNFYPRNEPDSIPLEQLFSIAER